MKIFLERDNSLKDLEETVNRKLEELEDNANTVKGITYATHTVPKMRGERLWGMMFSIL